MNPPFGTLNATLAQTIVRNAPKVSRWVEPFADGGTLALELRKKKPREHVVNIMDETLFSAFTFAQQAGGSDLRAVKKFDWVGSQETFDAAMAITATEGPEAFYRFLYTKKFGVKAADGSLIFDLLSTGKNGEKHLIAMPLMRVGLKGVTLSNEDPFTVLGAAGASDFLVLLPSKPDDIETVKGRLASLGGQFFFAAKVKDSAAIVDLANQLQKLHVGSVSAATIMMATLSAVWNYDSKLEPLPPGILDQATRGIAPAKRFEKGTSRRLKTWLKQQSRGERNLQEVFERLFAKQRDTTIERLFDLLGKSAPAAAYKRPRGGGEGLVGLIFTPSEWYQPFAEAVRAPLAKLMLEGIAEERAEVKAAKQPSNLFIDLPPDVEQAVNVELDTILDRPYWRNIQETTRRRLAATMQEGIHDGDSVYQLAVRIGDGPTVPVEVGAEGVLGSASNTLRGQTIARTESTGALNAGHQIGQQELFDEGLIRKKEWLSVIDNATRDQHIAENGQKVRVDENFVLPNGETAPYPGYYGLSAGQRVNCRCTSLSSIT